MPLDRARLLQLGEAVWLLIDEYGNPRFVMRYGPAVNRVTGETHMRYRVDHHTVRVKDRWPLGFYDTIFEAEAAMRADLNKPTEQHGTGQYPGG